VSGGGLSAIEQEALGTLVTDGGHVSPDDIADDHGRHIDAVYRALGRMDDLVDREYGSVSLKSTYVAELVHDAIQQAETAVSRAVDATSNALEAADRGLDEKTSAFIAWAETHGLNFDEKDDGVNVRLGEVDADSQKDARKEARRILREGFKRWRDMNRDEVKYRLGSWKARVEVPTETAQLRSVDSDETRTEYVGGENFKALN